MERKEAIEIVRKLYNESLFLKKDKEAIVTLIPELEDSEDERIRKEIIATIHLYYGEPLEDEAKEMIAWLEKQSKTSKVEEAMREIEEKAKAFTEAHKGETSEEILAQMKGELKHAAWSEEDERDFDTVYGIIYNSCNAEDASRLIEWLKSLKDRVQSQPSQEWSEEDRITRNALIKLVEKLYESSIYELDKNRLLDWLKSLRPQNRCTYNPYKEVVESIAEMCEKYEDANLDSLKDFYSNVKVKCKDAKEYDSLFPQSTWKPSDEQLYNK